MLLFLNFSSTREIINLLPLINRTKQHNHKTKDCKFEAFKILLTLNISIRDDTFFKDQFAKESTETPPNLPERAPREGENRPGTLGKLAGKL